MSIYLSKEKTAEIFTEYAGSASNTGSTEGQVALLTYRIQSISDHLKANHKDHSSRRSLLKLVGKRRSLLKYLVKKDIVKYRELIEKLGMRDVLGKSK
jgi:small subunit ribosomal protein S15